jgi:hypothetical protein
MPKAGLGVNVGFDDPLARSNIDKRIARLAQYRSLTGIVQTRGAHIFVENDTKKKTMSGEGIIWRDNLKKGAWSESRFMGQIDEVGAYGSDTPTVDTRPDTHVMKVYVSEVDSKRQNLPDELAQAIIANKVPNYPAEIRQRLGDFNANSTDISFIQALLLGVGSELLDVPKGARPFALGNFGVAGVAQMCRNFYLGAEGTNAGFVPFDATQATWNARVRDAMFNAAAWGTTTSLLEIIDDIIDNLSTIGFNGMAIEGKTNKEGYLATAVLEPILLNRIKRALEARRALVETRTTLENNPLFQSSAFKYKDVWFVPHPQMMRFRVNSQQTQIDRVHFGEDLQAKRGVILPGNPMLNEIAASGTVYDLAPMMFMSAGAVRMATKSGVRTVDILSEDKKSASVFTRFQYGMNRAEYWTDDLLDTSAGACINTSSVVALLPRHGIIA